MNWPLFFLAELAVESETESAMVNPLILQVVARSFMVVFI